MATRKYGWKPDSPDPRDLQYTAFMPVMAAELPPKVDLVQRFGVPCYDQGDIGSCTANAIGAAYQYNQVRFGQANFVPSRLYIYFNERLVEGSINEDAGAMIRDGMKVIHALGVCPETMWPYTKPFNKFPSLKCYREGQRHQTKKYYRLPRVLANLKQCLANGDPFVFGFEVYEGFENDGLWLDFTMPTPGPSEQLLGGHAVIAMGYDDDRQAFLIRNSWGTDWMDNGHFWMPYGFLVSAYCDDFWMIKTSEG